MPSISGASTSTASSGAPSASRSAAAARRIPAAVALVGPHGGERGARRRPVALQRLHEDDPAAYVHRERVLTLERGMQPVRGAELSQRLLEPALPEPQEGPRELEDGLRLELPRPGSARPASSHRSASSKRPSHASAAARRRDRGREDAMCSPSVGLGDRHRLLAQPQPDGPASLPGRRPARGGRGSRPPGRAGRCGVRARAPPRGRGGRRPAAATTARRCRGSSGPRRDGRCCARARRPSARRTTASPDARRRGRRADTRARASRWPAVGRTAASARRVPSRPAAPPTAMCVPLSSSRPSYRRAGGERERQLGILLGRARREGGQQRAQRRLAAVEDEVDVVVGQQAGGVRPVARGLRVPDRLDHVPVLLEPHRRGAVQRVDRSPGRSGGARAAAGRSAGGGSETTSARRPATRRRRSRPRGPAGSPPSPCGPSARRRAGR